MQAAYLYVIFEAAGVKPARATPAQMIEMVQQLAAIMPSSASVPPIAEHLHSLGMNAAAPEPVSSIVNPPYHHMEIARRTLEQPASSSFRRLLDAGNRDGGRPEEDTSLVCLQLTPLHPLAHLEHQIAQAAKMTYLCLAHPGKI